MPAAIGPGTDDASHAGDAARLAAPFALGTLAGNLFPWPFAWLLLAPPAIWLAWRAQRRRSRPTVHDLHDRVLHGTPLLLALLCVMAAYTAVRVHRVPADSVERFLTAEGQLAEVVGVIASPPRLAPPDRGFFADFSYERPSTLFTLRLETLELHGQSDPLSGRLLIKIDEAMLELGVGQRVRVLGWLGDFGPVKNPGEFDYRQHMRRRGVAGRLSVTAREHVVPLGEAFTVPGRAWLTNGIDAANAAARRALADGIAGRPERLALLETLLLGRTEGSIDHLHETFRRVGLAHILSISGAHLGILVLLVWSIAKVFSGSPRRVALVVLLFVVLYAALLPTRTPILRAAIMASAFFLPAAMGRQVRPGRALAFAMIVVLLWKPQELLSPGFQLSFAAVAAIMAFTRRISRAIWPEPLVPVLHPSALQIVGRAVVDYLAVSIAAFVAVLPIVTFHFGVISPLAVLLSMLAWPVLFGVLALGYLKILLGLVLPSVGLALSGPLAWVVDTLVNLAERADTWPGSSVALRAPVSVAWTLAASALGVLLLAGRFARYRKSALVCVLLVAGWLAVEQGVVSRWWKSDPALSVTMLAVGDGSCFVVRSGERTLVFDCGSQGYPEIGRRTAVPALHRLGVDRIDVLVLSHADLDHFSGVPELLEAVPTARVVCSPEVLRDAVDRPDSATAKLLAWLREQRLAPEPVTAGWSEPFGNASLTALWPPPGLDAQRSNDHSLVLRFEAAGRVVLLNGDLQQRATDALLATDADLAADVTDLPHHGSFVDASPTWLWRVKPAIVLQSSGPDRLRDDRWADVLAGSDARRVVSHEAGMTTVTVADDGELSVERFIPTPENADENQRGTSKPDGTPNRRARAGV